MNRLCAAALPRSHVCHGNRNRERDDVEKLRGNEPDIARLGCKGTRVGGHYDGEAGKGCRYREREAQFAKRHVTGVLTLRDQARLPNKQRAPRQRRERMQQDGRTFPDLAKSLAIASSAKPAITTSSNSPDIQRKKGSPPGRMFLFEIAAPPLLELPTQG